jgi:hypothetical protein
LLLLGVQEVAIKVLGITGITAVLVVERAPTMVAALYFTAAREQQDKAMTVGIPT